MKYITKNQQFYIDNHFYHFPNKQKSSRLKINHKFSSYYNAKKKRFHVHRNNAEKSGVQYLYFEHSNGIIRTMTSQPIKFYDTGSHATAKDCAMYQGFPPNFQLPDCRIFELFGNAITVPVAVHVIQKLKKHGVANTMIDLCSGIGGFHIAAKQVFPNIKCLGFSEVKPSAIKCYKKNFPNTPELGDLRTAVIPKCDLLCAGFPCQPFSSCASRIKEHKLKGMWVYIVRAIKCSEAKFVVLENVPLLEKSPIFIELQKSLKDLGYEIQFNTYNSMDFGVKQNRKRMYLHLYKKYTSPLLV